MRVPLKLKYEGKTYYAWIDEDDYARCIPYKWTICKQPDGVMYVQAWVKSQKMKLHRFLLGRRIGDGTIVDHIDRDPFNNTKTNLRLVTRSMNNRNVKIRGKTSKYPGVCRDKPSGKWLAQIRVDKKNVYLGKFVLEEMAAKAYRDAVKKLDPLIHHAVWDDLK